MWDWFAFKTGKFDMGTKKKRTGGHPYPPIHSSFAHIQGVKWSIDQFFFSIAQHIVFVKSFVLYFNEYPPDFVDPLFRGFSS